MIGSLLRIILKNSALKFFSLLLAITLWFFVMGEKKAEFSFSDVPLALINKPEGLIITDKTADRISLRVSGSRTILATLSSNKLEATIDLEGVKPGTTIVRNIADRVKLPNGTKITSISPAECTLILEQLVTKKVPVHLVIEGNPEEGYEVSSASAIPAFVEVSVPKSEAKKLEKVMSEPLDISNAKGEVKKEIDLVLDGFDSSRSISEKKVHASITITEKIIEKTIPGIEVRVVNNLYKTDVTPHSLQLTVKGPFHLINELSENNIDASIDLGGVKPGNYSKNAEIELPENVSIVEGKPPLFKIVVSKKLLKK